MKMKNIFLTFIILLMFFCTKNVFAHEIFKLDEYVYFDPVTADKCNENNYWTFYNQNTTCFRFMVLDANDNENKDSILLLLDHNLEIDSYFNSDNIIRNNTVNWIRQTGDPSLPTEDRIADIMKLGSNRPIIGEDGQSTSINGGLTLSTLYTNTDNLIFDGNKIVRYESNGYWLSGNYSDFNYAYTVTQYGNNKVVPKTSYRGVRPVVTVKKSLLNKSSLTNISNKINNSIEYKYKNEKEKYDGKTYKQLQGFTVTNDRLVFYSSNKNNPDNGLLFSYGNNDFSKKKTLNYLPLGQGNDMTYIPSNNRVLIVGSNEYQTIKEYNGTTLTETNNYSPGVKYTSIGYDDYNNQIIGHNKRRLFFMDKNFNQKYSVDLTHLITGQGFEYHNGYVYASSYESGNSSDYQLYTFGNAYTSKIYVIDSRLKKDGTPDKGFGRVAKILYIDNINRNGTSGGTGAIESVSFRNNKMWLGYSSQNFDNTYSYKFYILDDSEVANPPIVNVSYKVEDDYTKVILTSNVQLHSLSGWSLSSDNYTLSKNFYDAVASNTITVCDNYSNCTDVNIDELTIKKQKVSFSNLDVTKPFSDGTFTLTASTDGDGDIEYKSSNESIAIVDANGKVTFKKIGRVDISAVAKKTDNYYQGTSFYTLRITKDTQSLDFTETQINKKYGENTFTIAANHLVGDGEISYDSSNEDVASVNNSGTVTINGVGSTVITATATETNFYSSSSASYSLNIVPNAQVLKFGESTVTKKYGDDDFIIEVEQLSGNGNIVFSSSNNDVATVDENGNVSIKGVGSSIITATASATVNYDSSSTSYSLNVLKGEQIIEIDETIKNNINKKIGDSKFNLKADLNVGDGNITYLSSNERVATIDEEGYVTIVGVGETVLSINVSETDNYEETGKSILLNVDNVDNPKDILEDIPNTSKGIPFETIRNIFSFFLIFLGVTYIVRKKSIFEK